MREEYIVIEVPHQMPVTATLFADEAEAFACFENLAANDWRHTEAWEHIASSPELIWEWAAHDLHALYRYTVEEASEELARLREPNGGQQKIHQQLNVTASLERFVEGWEE